MEKRAGRNKVILSLTSMASTLGPERRLSWKRRGDASVLPPVTGKEEFVFTPTELAVSEYTDPLLFGEEREPQSGHTLNYMFASSSDAQVELVRNGFIWDLIRFVLEL